MIDHITVEDNGLNLSARVATETLDWIKHIVIGEGLCPFAAPVLETLLIEVHEESDENSLTESLMLMLQRFMETPADILPTGLFVTPNAFVDFDSYWNWIIICDTLLQQLGYEGTLQLATFHPSYMFEGEDENDLSHFTNRSPYPMVHVIRENDVEQALASVKFPERIPERNRNHMRRLGRDGLLAVMPSLHKLFADH